MYAIDKIENDIILAEDLETKEKISLTKEDFSFPIHEGTMFSIKDNKIIEESSKEQDRRRILREKMERLKHHE